MKALHFMADWIYEQLIATLGAPPYAKGSPQPY
jgi:hypothetical protein